VTTIQAIVLGIVQGVGEFLPISSSAHLYLVPWILGWDESGLAFDLALHLGTLAAVTLYFWRDLIALLVEGLTKGTRTPRGRLAWGIVVGTIPGGLFGLLLSERMDIVRNPISIAILLALMGVVLYLADRGGKKNRTIEDIKVMDLVWMGIGQAVAIIPGVSRSGSTISTGLLIGLDRESAAKVSFLLGWPITLAAGIFATKGMSAGELTPAFWTGVVVSALVGYAVIAFLLEYLKRGTFLVFAWYRTGLSALTLLIAYYRG